jgi:hypothetical protein
MVAWWGKRNRREEKKKWFACVALDVQWHLGVIMFKQYVFVGKRFAGLRESCGKHLQRCFA